MTKEKVACPLIPKAPLPTVPLNSWSLMTVEDTQYPRTTSMWPVHFPNQTDHSYVGFKSLFHAHTRILSKYLLPLISQASQNLSLFCFELAFLSLYFGNWVEFTPELQDSSHGGSNSNIKIETLDTGNVLLCCQPVPSGRFSLPCQISGGKQPAPSVVGNHLQADTHF